MPHYEIKVKQSIKNTVTYSARIPLTSLFIALIATFISAVSNAAPSVSTSVICGQINKDTFNEESICVVENCTLVKKEADCKNEIEINKFHDVRNNRRCFTYTHELPRIRF